MTTLALLPGGQASEVLREALGEDPAQIAGIADLIRDEVTGRGACPRAATIKRLCRFVSPAVTLDEALVTDVCDRLERDGDLVLAAGGVLYSMPLRAIDRGQGVLRFASSLSTRRLAAQVVGIWTVAGTSRTCQVADADQARAAIVAAGGIVISPWDWACLDRTARADQDWLEALDRRLAAEPETPASLERDESLVWAGCAVADGQLRLKWTPCPGQFSLEFKLSCRRSSQRFGAAPAAAEPSFTTASDQRSREEICYCCAAGVLSPRRRSCGDLLVPTLQRGNAVPPLQRRVGRRDAGASALAPTLERGS